MSLKIGISGEPLGMPLDLIDNITLVMLSIREDVEKMMSEVKALVRRVRIRKYARWMP